MKTKNTKDTHSSSENPDFYFEKGLKVMTEKYHLTRGYCCSSGCRHCPYKKGGKN
jgi:hypothetical protein